MLRFLSLSVLGLALSGCVTPPVEFPAWDIPEATTSIQQPIAVPDKPLAASSTATTVTFDLQGIQELEKLYQVAITNAAISKANAAALEAQAMAFNSLLQAAKVQRQIAMIKADMLAQERSAHKWDNWFYRGIIAIIGIGAVL